MKELVCMKCGRRYATMSFSEKVTHACGACGNVLEVVNEKVIETLG